ncbi:MAG: Mu transposase C-terminal domain-containing protein [Thermoanaerobaculaceae bacterium]|nr:Mu transposase C-terminal domain-containing protein [Thermoanaerobaculaceae bacterium]
MLTLRELETWLATYVVDVYHQSLHDGLGTTPLQRFHDGIFGVEGQPGRGLPDRIVAEDRLRLDFMPYVERSVLRYGIVLDGVHYYHDVLRSWINARDPEHAKRRRRFVVRRDPRDISVVYFLDPELQQYFQIPYRDSSRPPLSIWELREAHRKLRDEGRRKVNEDVIFEAYARMRALEETARKETRTARRSEERRRHHQGLHAHESGPPAGPPGSELPAHVEPFAEMEQESD